MKRFDTEAASRAYAQGRADAVRSVESSVQEVLREAQVAAWAEGLRAGMDTGISIGEASMGIKDYPRVPDNPYARGEEV